MDVVEARRFSHVSNTSILINQSQTNQLHQLSYNQSNFQSEYIAIHRNTSQYITMHHNASQLRIGWMFPVILFLAVIQYSSGQESGLVDLEACLYRLGGKSLLQSLVTPSQSLLGENYAWERIQKGAFMKLETKRVKGNNLFLIQKVRK